MASKRSIQQSRRIMNSLQSLYAERNGALEAIRKVDSRIADLIRDGIQLFVSPKKLEIAWECFESVKGPEDYRKVVILAKKAQSSLDQELKEYHTLWEFFIRGREQLADLDYYGGDFTDLWSVFNSLERAFSKGFYGKVKKGADSFEIKIQNMKGAALQVFSDDLLDKIERNQWINLTQEYDALMWAVSLLEEGRAQEAEENLRQQDEIIKMKLELAHDARNAIDEYQSKLINIEGQGMDVSMYKPRISEMRHYFNAGDYRNVVASTNQFMNELDWAFDNWTRRLEQERELNIHSVQEMISRAEAKIKELDCDVDNEEELMGFLDESRGHIEYEDIEDARKSIQKFYEKYNILACKGKILQIDELVKELDQYPDANLDNVRQALESAKDFARADDLQSTEVAISQAKDMMRRELGAVMIAKDGIEELKRLIEDLDQKGFSISQYRHLPLELDSVIKMGRFQEAVQNCQQYIVELRTQSNQFFLRIRRDLGPAKKEFQETYSQFLSQMKDAKKLGVDMEDADDLLDDIKDKVEEGKLKLPEDYQKLTKYCQAGMSALNRAKRRMGKKS